MLVRFKDSPEPHQPTTIPPESGNKVMHATLRTADATVMASDGRCQRVPSFQGLSLSITVPDEVKAERLFASLAEGGQVQMPFDQDRHLGTKCHGDAELSRCVCVRRAGSRKQIASLTGVCQN